MDLRLALKRLEDSDLLHVIEKETSVEYEMAAHLKKWDGKKAVLFEKPLLPDGRESPFRVVGGVATSRETLLTSFGISDMKEMRGRIRRALKNPVPAVEGDPEWVRANIELSDLPILKHYTGEPGPYMTASIVVFKDEDGLFSSSYHRMMPIGDKKLVLRAVEGRKLSRTIERFSERGEDLPAAISIGSPLEVMVASAVPAENMDKMALAGGIAGEPVSISPCEGVEAWAPSSSEIVVCGKILAGERAPEGPFYEILGKDIVRQQPVFEVEEIYARPGGFYQAILPAGSEHQLLMGLPVEPLIEDRVSEVADVVDVAMTPGGAGWIEVAISIRKSSPDQPALAGLMAIAAHKSLKRVIVVDDDVDVSDYVEVMRAVLQRAHIPDDFKVISGIKGSSLDHSNLREIELDGERRLIRLPQGKMIVDATVKGPRELTERPRNPYL